MSYYSSGPMQKLFKARQAENLAKALVPKKYAMLRHMIDGIPDRFDPKTIRNGTGSVYLNFQGGWGIDSEIKRMIKDGLITISRIRHHDSSFGGNPTINATMATVTDKGREAYSRWKKKNLYKFV